MTAPNTSTIVQGLEALAVAPPQDKKLQKRLYDAAQRLSLAVGSPYDTIHRVVYSIYEMEPSNSPMGLTRLAIANGLDAYADRKSYEAIHYSSGGGIAIHNGRTCRCVRSRRAVYR